MTEADIAHHTDKGTVREENEDTVGSVIPTEPVVRERKGVICAIADGLGGHAAGQVASATAVKTLFDEYYAPSNASRVEQALRHAMQTANLRVHDLSQKNLEYRSMATTLSVLAMVGNTAYVGHVGDSRIYHLRGSSFMQITQDHSEVAELVRMRVVKPEMAREHPSRNVLTRVLGHQLLLRPDFSRVPIHAGDAFLQCTDGVWSELTDDELAQAISTDSPTGACHKIIETCLERGCQDNVTVQVIKVTAIDDQPAGPSQDRLLGGIFNRFGTARIRR